MSEPDRHSAGTGGGIAAPTAVSPTDGLERVVAELASRVGQLHSCVDGMRGDVTGMRSDLNVCSETVARVSGKIEAIELRAKTAVARAIGAEADVRTLRQRLDAEVQLDRKRQERKLVQRENELAANERRNATERARMRSSGGTEPPPAAGDELEPLSAGESWRAMSRKTRGLTATAGVAGLAGALYALAEVLGKLVELVK